MMQPFFNRRVMLRLAAVALTLGPATVSAETYPEKPITIVVGWGAGGGMDTFARIVAQHLPQYVGVDVGVENIKGGGGKVAHERLINEFAADGYTISASSIPHQTIPTQISEGGYRLDDLAWVANMASIPSTIIVRSSSPEQSFSDLVETAQANPGALTAGSPGATSGAAAFHHAWVDASDVDVTLIPYRGGSAMYKGLAGEEIYAMSTNANWALRYPDETRALAVAGEERYPLLPDVPTLKELGIDIVDYTTRTFTVAAATPQDRIDTLSTALGELAKDPEFIEAMKTAGLVVDFRDNAGAEAMVADYVAGNSEIFEMMSKLQGN
ncbi:MAG: tripartite tricarboxylate transporter substrate binding protein [Pseudomonadota bacterium]